MKLAGTAFKNAEFVELVSQHFVPVLVDTKAKDNKTLVDYYGVATTPMLVYTDPTGEAMKLTEDARPVAECVADVRRAIELLNELKKDAEK